MDPVEQRTSVYEATLLAQCIYREARGEGRSGMTAVGCVVRNRVDAGMYGGTYYGNITGRNQFTAMSLRGDPNATVWLDPRTSIGKVALDIAFRIVNREQVDVTGGALYYENPRVATSGWFVRNVRDVRPVTARIGSHVFYA